MFDVNQLAQLGSYYLAIMACKEAGRHELARQLSQELGGVIRMILNE